METISRILLTFLLNSLWQIPVVAAVALLACRLMRRGPAAHQHMVWVAALLAAVLLPVASVRPRAETASLLLTPSFAAPPAAAPRASNAAVRPAVRPARATNTRTVSFARVTATVLFCVYLAFLLFRVATLARAWMRTVQIRRAAGAPEPRPLVQSVWARCLRAFGLNGVELLSSPNLDSPVTAGEWRKTIILPSSLFSETSEDALTTAIGHEMAHIARHDFASRLAQELLYLPVAFHPAAWLIRRGIERTREMACDELVTRELMDAGVYARAMVGIASAMTALRRPGFSLGVFDCDILEERIRRLMERPAANLKRARLLLASGLSALAVCAAIASGLAITARAQSPASGEMKLGELALHNGDLINATLHYRNAVRLDPADIAAKLELGSVLARQFIPGETPPDSPLLAEARQQFLDALALDPRNKTAVATLTALTANAKQFGEAHDWAMKLIQLDPEDKTGYCTAAFIDWSVAYPEVQRARSAAGMRPETSGAIPDAGARQALRDLHMPRIEEGLRMLGRAIELDPSYADAMAYMNLIYRLEAVIVDTPAESAELIAKADYWVTQALATAKKLSRTGSQQTGPSQSAEPRPASAASGVPLSIGGALGGSQMMVAPPPPPPPLALKFSDGTPASANPMPSPRRDSGSCWQVVGDAGMPANKLERLLRSKGFPAMIVVSGQDSPVVRVMAGPYFDAQSVEQAKAALERGGFKPIRVW